MRAVRSLAALFVATTAACGGGSDSPAAPSGPPSGPPSAPSGVQGTAVSTSAIRVTWNAVSGATTYIVERTSPSLPLRRTTASTTALDDVDLLPSTTYTYQIAAVRGTDTSLFSSAVAVATRSVGSVSAVLRGAITASRTLSADTQYVIEGFVKVRAGATLTIPAGTRLVGDTTIVASSLWILRGARIVAQGTAARPIVFTSRRAAGARGAGDWGGVVIIGNAPVSRNAADAVTYGRVGTDRAPESYGGGTTTTDDSGILRYVRIEFAGAAPNPGDDQMAGLTLYAVGRGTAIENVQTLESLGSGVAWYGGSVDARYLVSYEAGDDHFSWAEGYSGRNQFVIGFQSHQPTGREEAGLPSSTPRGIQGYGCDINVAGCASYVSAPISAPVFANVTLVGPGPNVYPSSIALRASGVTLGRGSGGTLVNGVVTRWPSVGLNVRDAITDTLRQRDSLFVSAVLLADNAAGNFDPADGANFGLPANFPGVVSATATATSLFTALPTLPGTADALDFTPSTTSALRSGGLATFPARVTARTANFFGGTLATTTYRGAADPAAAMRWWQGWTSYARN